MDNPITRDQRRNRRPRPVRAKTECSARATKFMLRFYGQDADAILGALDGQAIGRPKTRAECAGGERPCPFVSCAHHLYLDVGGVRASRGKEPSIKFNFPDIAPEELEQMPQTCALDVADDGGATLEHVGEVMNLTRERVRQVELVAMRKVRDALAALHGLDGEGKRRLPIAEVA